MHVWERHKNLEIWHTESMNMGGIQSSYKTPVEAQEDNYTYSTSSASITFERNNERT